MEIKKIWEILVRRKWVIVQGFVIVFGIIMIATFLKPKTYLAECIAVLESEGTQEALLRSMGLEEVSEMLFSANMSQTSSLMEVEAKKMLAKPVLDKVAQKLNLRGADGSFLSGSALKAESPTFQWFSIRGLAIKPSKRSTVFSIQGYSPNPQEAVDLANTLAEVYVAEDIARKHRETADAARFADEQSKIAKRDWNEAKRKLREFQEQENIVDVNNELQSLISQIAELRAQQNMMDLSLQEINTMEANLQGQSDMVGGSTISEQAQIGQLKQQLSGLEAELQSSLTKYTDSHPTIIAMRQQIIDLQKKLLQEKDIYQTSEVARAGEIENQIAHYQVELQEFPEKLYTLAQLQLASTTSENLYQMLLEMKYRLNITKAMQISRVNIIEPAWRAKIHSPKADDNALIGALLGVIFGLGLAIMVEYLDDSVKNAESVQAVLGLPLVGSIPLMTRRQIPLIASMDSHLEKKTLFFLRESFNILAHNIKLGSLDAPVKTIMITSSIPSEGKTRIAANLAINMAQSGKNVLLVDTDYPRPDIYHVFGLENEIGLTEVILGEATIEEVVKPSGINNLWIITTGPKPPNTTRLFDSNQFREFIKETEKLFDMVIFDTPPLFSLNDPVVLGSMVDRTIVIASAGEITKTMLKQAVETLQRGNCQLLGIVLNKVQMAGSYYYHYYYSYNHGDRKSLKRLARKPLALLGINKASRRRSRPSGS